MTAIIFAIVFVVVGTLAYMALRNAQDFSDANEIIPGVRTNAPKEWAGAHSPEARLHRRLRDAMEAVRANAALDDPSLIDVRMSLEQQALATDERLIAAAALPKGRREEPVAAVAETVEEIEGLVASLVELRGPALTATQQQIDDMRVRLALIAEARDELAGLGTTTPDLEALRERLEGESAASGSVADEPDEPDDEAGPQPSS